MSIETEKSKLVPLKEIKEDIFLTENEIVILEREIKGLELLGDRMSMFRADAKRSGIRERKIFIDKLKVLLSEREKEEPL